MCVQCWPMPTPTHPRVFSDADQAWSISTTDQLKASDYADLVVAYRGNAAVKLSDIASVIDSVEDLRNVGFVNADPAVIVYINRQPGANIVETVDRVLEVLPRSGDPGVHHHHDFERPDHHHSRFGA